jgi:B12-binding domain/radical SAM domain protein of rhizo-twelve system
MKYALVNPNWTFEGSTYFGCREPHLPIELLSAQNFIRRLGHETMVLDAQMEGWSPSETRDRMARFDPDFLVLPSAPSYLFWRCPPPELRVPQEWFAALKGKAKAVIIGPHASATPAAAMRKTGADVAMRGEPDETLGLLASEPWDRIAGCCWRQGEQIHVTGSIASTEMSQLGTLDFSDYPVERHAHMHHVFTEHTGLGAELEFARGCPWSCTFCNKTLVRNKFRERPVETVLDEIHALVDRGVTYIYFIDEIFGVGKNVRRLLEEIARLPLSIGFQTRIDLWNEETLDLLGRAHCISFECGVESITENGREELNKNCRISTERITELLKCARRHIPWVQANLIETLHDDPEKVDAWQEDLKHAGVWVSEPVPMFPFPGSPLYVQTFGVAPDDEAWERAHRYYLQLFREHGYSDIQEQQPAPLEALECAS